MNRFVLQSFFLYDTRMNFVQQFLFNLVLMFGEKLQNICINHFCCMHPPDKICVSEINPIDYLDMKVAGRRKLRYQSKHIDRMREAVNSRIMYWQWCSDFFKWIIVGNWITGFVHFLPKISILNHLAEMDDLKRGKRSIARKFIKFFWLNAKNLINKLIPGCSSIQRDCGTWSWPSLTEIILIIPIIKNIVNE